MKKKGRVLVAMSGGLDSTMAAVLLKEQGYDLVGITMKTWDYAIAPTKDKKETGCCSLDSINDAREVAVSLGFPHYIIDIREEFSGSVIDYFVSGYLNGETPNPCVVCNTKIKWSALVKRADALGCDFIATGHYAKIRELNGRYFLRKSWDRFKDQTYFLWGMQQEVLKRAIFPVGTYIKPQIREMAKVRGFEHVAKKSESYDICFVPNNDYREFLKKNVSNVENEYIGDFVLQDGTVVGTHKGYPFYTIGQRKGVIALGKPMYVLDIQPETKKIVIGGKDELLQHKMIVRDINLLKYEKMTHGMKVQTQVRYNDSPVESILNPIDDTSVEVIFDAPVKAITPGQAAIFYEDIDIIGGGWIDKTIIE